MSNRTARVLRSTATLLTLQASLLVAGIAQAQGAGGATPIEATRLAGNVYLLTGGSGANSSALVGPDGVLLVDSKSDTASAEGILEALAALGDGGIRYLVNTHEHPDHTGGNEFFGRQGAAIIAGQGARDVLAAGQRGGAPAPDVALPIVTIGAAGRMTLHLNGETIEVLDMPPAHTASNAIVRFVDADVYHLGDLYTRTRYPVLAGGTVQGFIDSADRLLEMSDADSRFIPGVGEVGDREDLMRYRDMLVTVRDRVAELIRQGLSEEEVIAANPTAEFDAVYGDPGRLFLPPLYQELSADAASSAEEDDVPRTESGECFTTSDLVDMTVLDDRSVYVRTRSRHFLLASGRQCNNLRRAYERNAVGFVPLGRRICPGDGSHFRYETAGRARTCPIALVTEVESLAQARELARSRAGSDDDLVTTRDLDPADRQE